MPKLPKINDRKMINPDRMFKIEQLDLEFSNGQQRTFTRLITHGLGAVIIVPMIDENTVLLLREYCVGTHGYELGLPKGRLEKGETILEGANRELKEESGYGAEMLTELTSLTLAPGYMTHRTHVVLAQSLYPERLQGDEPEIMETVPWPMDRLPELVAREDCSEGRTIAALYIARDFLNGRSDG